MDLIHFLRGVYTGSDPDLLAFTGIHLDLIHFLRGVYTGSDPDLLAFTRDPFGSDPLFEGCIHGIGSRSVGVYTGSIWI